MIGDVLFADCFEYIRGCGRRFTRFGLYAFDGAPKLIINRREVALFD